MKNAAKSRIGWVDTAKFICISCVLFSHMEYVPSFLQCVFKPFFLSCFFFLTGYVFSTKRTFTGFVVNRCKTLLGPALLFSVIYLIDFQALLNGAYSLSLLLEDMSILLYQQRGRGDVLWFLYVSFLAEIPLYFLMQKCSLRTTLGISAMLCELSIIYVKHFMKEPPYWYVHIIFVAMLLMVVGICYRRYEEKLEICHGKSLMNGVAGLVYLAIVWIGYYHFGYFVNVNEYGAPQIIWFITVGVGIYLCITWAKKLPANRFVLFCGSNTIVFYLLHDRVRGILNLLMEKMGIWEYAFKSMFTRSITTVIIYFAEILVLMLLAWLVQKYVPFIIGRNYPRKMVKK